MRMVEQPRPTTPKAVHFEEAIARDRSPSPVNQGQGTPRNSSRERQNNTEQGGNYRGGGNQRGRGYNYNSGNNFRANPNYQGGQWNNPNNGGWENNQGYNWPNQYQNMCSMVPMVPMVPGMSPSNINPMPQQGNQPIPPLMGGATPGMGGNNNALPQPNQGGMQNMGDMAQQNQPYGQRGLQGQFRGGWNG